MIGLPAGIPREPVQPLSSTSEARLREVMDYCGLLGEETGIKRVAG